MKTECSLCDTPFGELLDGVLHKFMAINVAVATR